MALRGRKIENFDDISLPAWSQGLPNCVSLTSFQKSSIGWPQQPPGKFGPHPVGGYGCLKESIVLSGR